VTSEYPIEVKTKNPATGQVKKYNLRQCTALEDDSLVTQRLDAKGKPNDKEIWLSRVVRDFENMDDAKVRKMARWEYETLLQFWKKYNEMDITSFLEVTATIEDPPKNDTSSQSS